MNARVAVVSGAFGNLGQIVCKAFHEAGHSLVLVQHTLEKVQIREKELEDPRHLRVVADLSKPAEAERVVTEALKRFGRVEILLNLAGGFTGGKPIVETPVEDLDRMFDLNVRTAYYACRAAVKPMAERGWGRIVNISSSAAIHAQPNFAAYAMAKAALLRMTESLAEEAREKGVRVNAVLPDIIDTPANRAAMPSADFSRWVKPADIVAAIFFLTGDVSAVNGAAIRMDRPA